MPRSGTFLSFAKRAAPPGAALLQIASLRPRMSADVGNPFLRLRLRGVLRLGGKLQHRRFLALAQIGEQNDLSVRELERIVMHPKRVLVDLPEDRRLVVDGLRSPPERARRHAGRLL